jgi:hypothetical protein
VEANPSTPVENRPGAIELDRGADDDHHRHEQHQEARCEDGIEASLRRSVDHRSPLHPDSRTI